MYYYFNYSFLEDKLISHYKTKTLIQAIDCFGKDMHSNIYRIREEKYESNKKTIRKYQQKIQ